MCTKYCNVFLGGLMVERHLRGTDEVLVSEVFPTGVDGVLADVEVGLGTTAEFVQAVKGVPFEVHKFPVLVFLVGDLETETVLGTLLEEHVFVNEIRPGH